MKCYESMVVGMFLGALVLCILMLNFPEQKNCSVKISHGNGNVAYVSYGVWEE